MWKSYLQCLSKKGNIHSLYVQYPSRWSDRFHSVFRFDNETDFSLRLTHTNPPRGKQGRLLDRREMVRGAHMETGEQTYVMKVSICRDSNTRWGAGELITTGVPEGGDQEDPASARACTHTHTHTHKQTDRGERESWWRARKTGRSTTRTEGLWQSPFLLRLERENNHQTLIGEPLPANILTFNDYCLHVYSSHSCHIMIENSYIMKGVQIINLAFCLKFLQQCWLSMSFDRHKDN